MKKEVAAILLVVAFLFITSYPPVSAENDVIKLDKSFIQNVQKVEGIQKIPTNFDIKSFKCGADLTLKERIKCKANLKSEDEKSSNFFPEHCKNSDNLEKCLYVQKLTSECKILKEHDKRISCFKERIGIGNREKIAEERIKCKEDKQCGQALNEGLKNMVLLRLDNLVKQAETLQKRGHLGEDELFKFTELVELKKLEFSEATTKQEMRDIISEVKTTWKELVGGING